MMTLGTLKGLFVTVRRFIDDLGRHGREVDTDRPGRLQLQGLDDVFKTPADLLLAFASLSEVQGCKAKIDNGLRSGQGLHADLLLMTGRQWTVLKARKHAVVICYTEIDQVAVSFGHNMTLEFQSICDSNDG